MWEAIAWLLPPSSVWRASSVCTCQSSSLLYRRLSAQLSPARSHRPPKASVSMVTVKLACSLCPIHFPSSLQNVITKIKIEPHLFHLYTFEQLLLWMLHEYYSFYDFFPLLHCLHNLTVHIVLLCEGTIMAFLEGLLLCFSMQSFGMHAWKMMLCRSHFRH